MIFLLIIYKIKGRVGVKEEEYYFVLDLFLIILKIFGEGEVLKVKMRKKGFSNGRGIWKFGRFFRIVIYSFLNVFKWGGNW